MKRRFHIRDEPTPRARRSGGATVSPRSRRPSITGLWIRETVAAVTAQENAATDRTGGSGAKVPLRIAAVDPERAFSGGETQVMGLTLALLRAGHQAELICDPEGALWQRARAAGVVCHALSIRNSVDVAAGLRLRALLSRQGYDVVHFHTARAHALAPYVRGQARALVVTRRMDYTPNRLF